MQDMMMLYEYKLFIFHILMRILIHKAKYWLKYTVCEQMNTILY